MNGRCMSYGFTLRSMVMDRRDLVLIGVNDVGSESGGVTVVVRYRCQHTLP